jgi:quercetin dioxygenase-like cupin family protein
MLPVLCCAASALAAEKTGVSVHPLLSSKETITGQTIEVFPNPQVIAAVYEIAPGASLPVHEHPYARYAYILEGELHVTVVDTGKTIDSKAGDFIVEMRGQKHFGVNNGKVPARLLVIDQVPPGTQSNVIVSKQ